MNPIVIWRVVTVIAALFGTAYGYDQHRKQKLQQAAFRSQLAWKEHELSEMEARLNDLETQLGKKNDQQILPRHHRCSLPTDRAIL